MVLKNISPGCGVQASLMLFLTIRVEGFLTFFDIGRQKPVFDMTVLTSLNHKF